MRALQVGGCTRVRWIKNRVSPQREAWGEDKNEKATGYREAKEKNEEKRVRNYGTSP